MSDIAEALKKIKKFMGFFDRNDFVDYYTNGEYTGNLVKMLNAGLPVYDDNFPGAIFKFIPRSDGISIHLQLLAYDGTASRHETTQVARKMNRRGIIDLVGCESERYETQIDNAGLMFYKYHRHRDNPTQTAIMNRAPGDTCLGWLLVGIFDGTPDDPQSLAGKVWRERVKDNPYALESYTSAISTNDMPE